MEKEIWVCAEHQETEIHEVSLELLGEGRKLATRLGGKVCALLLGDNVVGLTDELIAYGADKVYLFQDHCLGRYTTDTYLQVISSLAAGCPPSLILIGATVNGNDLAPRLAARLGAGFASRVITIASEADYTLRVNRSAFLGKVYSVLTFQQDHMMVVTLEPGTVGLERPDRSRKGEVVSCPISQDALSSRTEVLKVLKADPKTVGIDEAEAVVAVGNSLRDPKDLDLVWDLADALGAAVASSKPVVDKGWLPRSRLVGQSGKRVSARVFLAAGISGATHFTEGMKDSKLIVAVNTDRSAPILKLADLVVLGDLYEILPELARQIRQGRQEAVQE